jgi:hypothetical protein
MIVYGGEILCIVGEGREKEGRREEEP